MMTIQRTLGIASLAVGALLASACNDVTVPNYNNGSLEQLTKNPDAATVNNAVVGMTISLRNRVGTEVSAMGILGKESYNLDQAEPRNVLGYLQGPIEPSGFVSDLGWSNGYRNIVQGATILEALTKVAESATPTPATYTAQQKEGIRGVVKTIIAMELLTQVRIRDQAGIVVDYSADPSAPLGAIVGKDAALTRIAALLDEASTHLQAAGSAFVFPLHSGFAGFNTPSTFRQFNRGILARVQVYRQKWPEALAALNESFIDATTATPAALARGVYHVYSTTSGDALNPLFDQTPTVYYVHPSILNGAQTRANGQPDLRLSSKTAPGVSRVTQTVQGTHKFMNYPTNVSPVPILKNEELILLRAEANIGLGNLPAALVDINTVRQTSGNMPPLASLGTPETALDELLYNKLYSLMFEGAHRWIDARHYGRLGDLPVDRPGDVVFETLPIPNKETLPRQ